MAGSTGTGAASGGMPRGGVAVAAGLIGLAFAGLVGATWVGFLESDDLEYATAAWLWLDAFPHLGQWHWALRHLIVLPMAGGFALLGRGEGALLLPAVGYAAGLVAMSGLCVGRVAGPVAGLLAALLVATLPVVATGASMVFSDIPEAFFVLGSLWAYHFATRSGRAGLFVLSGVLAGCGFITRETAVALLALYFVLFLMAPRRAMDFVRMAAGWLLVVGLDTAWLWGASGDPLWRLHVSQRGVAGDNPGLGRFVASAGSFDQHGVIAAPRGVQALLAVFANQNMGLLAWAGVPAAVALVRGALVRGALVRGTMPGRGAGLLFAGLALAWFAVLGFAMPFLWIVPRYQTVTMVALCVPLAIWLAGRLAGGARVVPALVVLAVVGSGVVLASAANTALMFGERGLVAFARLVPGPIHTDPMTAQGAEWLLAVEGLDGRVVAGPCVTGGFCYVNPMPRRGLPAGWAVQAVPPGAEVLLEVPRQRRPVVRVLDGVWLPAMLRAKLGVGEVLAVGFRMPEG